MKTPITYYGGKQCLAPVIIEMIPRHKIYCEPFIGGGAILFAKSPSDKEIINDKNKEVVNFYEVIQSDFDALLEEIEISLFSRLQHRHAQVIYHNPDLFDRVKRAWAVWVLANTSYGSKLTAIWGFDKGKKKISHFKNSKIIFDDTIFRRVKNVQIESYDAVKFIKDNDSAETFFYCDPPYVGADQGHYSGYTQAHFDLLLETLSELKGKFLLSSYPNIKFAEYLSKHHWYQIEFDMQSSMCRSALIVNPRKTEILTANYPIYKGGTPDLFYF